jgi:hypothetical protein
MNPPARSLLALVVVGAGSLLAGCDSKPPKVATIAVTAPAGNLREDAARLAARGNFAAAERTYREALRAQPDDVELHFGLGSVLSQLDRREAAAEEFRWVIQHGRPGRPEVDSARRWLAESGEAAPGSAATAAAEPEPTSLGGVSGKLTWPGLPADKRFAIRVVVARDGEGAALQKSARTKLNGTFSIAGLPEGTYKLTGLAGPIRVWSDVPITVAPGRETTVDLSPANAVVSATEFPARIR